MSYEFAAAEFASRMLGKPRFRSVPISATVAIPTEIGPGTDVDSYSDGKTTITFVGNAAEMRMVVERDGKVVLHETFQNFSQVMECLDEYAR